MTRFVVAKAADIPPNTRKLVIVKGRPIVVFNLNGEWFGLLNRCPHQGGNLCKGRQVGLVRADSPGNYVYSREGEIIRCPWHGWEFDIRTGRSICRPNSVKVRSFDVEAASFDEHPEDLVVETFEVTLHEEYLIVDV